MINAVVSQLAVKFLFLWDKLLLEAGYNVSMGVAALAPGPGGCKV